MAITADVVDEVVRALRDLAPPGVVAGARAIADADVGSLHDVEAAIVATAVAKRRREFATGRALLRSLLGTDEPVTVLTSRAPSLPAGVVASLAHDDELAVAAVSRDPSVLAIGVDVERVGAVGADVADTVRRPDERHLDATWVFVAKEAAYKAWSSLGGRFLRHEDVLVADSGDGGFTALVVDEHRLFTGRSCLVGGRVVALVVVIGHDEHR